MEDDRGISEEEQSLWREEIGLDEELKTQNLRVNEASKIGDENKKICTVTKQIKKEFSELVSGEITGVDGKTAEKLSKGKMEISDMIDLHGLTQEQAMNALLEFIPDCYAKNKRCVLVVTGKGAGVLRGNLSRWLNFEEIRKYVLAFTQAQPKDGGDGAFYVFVKKRK